MRVTNNMIMSNANSNINGTKVSVDKANTQMTTQKKISRPSEDPVTAIRSLRLSTSLSKINQYYEKNIPDAKSWLEVTETAVTNMKSIITDFRTLAVTGSTGTLTASDRESILTQLQSLQEEIYSEGNADYAGRTVFTGYRTDQTLTFSEEEADTSYEITETFDAVDDILKKNYYNGDNTCPTTGDEILNNDIYDMTQSSYYRIRLSYDEIDSVKSMKLGNTDYDMTTATDTVATVNGVDYTYQTLTGANGEKMYVFETEADWAAVIGSKDLDSDYDTAMIKETGELVMGDSVAADLKSSKAEVSITYDKTGFEKGELRPEYYFNCIDTSDQDSNNWITYQKYDDTGAEINYDIAYTVSTNQQLVVNLEASDVFDSSIRQDIQDMISAVDSAVSAHEKLTKVQTMIGEEQYASEEYQTKLAEWEDALQKEADYYDDNLTNLFSSYITSGDNYLSDISLTLTKIGCKVDQLELAEDRMSDQQETVEDLQSTNDDVDLSEIILSYTSAYTAYQSALTAAGKLGSVSLLNYI